MDININVKRKIKVNGIEYNSIEEMPHDIRTAFEKGITSRAGLGQQIKSTTVQTKIIFNGTEYKNIDAMPQENRQLYEKLMKAAESGAIQPDGDLLREVLGSETSKTVRTTNILKTVSIEPSFSQRRLIYGVILGALILLIYYVFKA